MKELVAVMSCQDHGEQSRIYAVQAVSEHVRHNVTEPADMQGVNECPVAGCGKPLEGKRHGLYSD